MSAALHKSSSPTARSASLELVAVPLAGIRPEADARDAEIARLTAEGEALREQLQVADRRWGNELEQVRAEAREAAAREFRSDDSRRLQAVSDALRAALAAFDAQLIDAVRRVAPRTGIVRLVVRCPPFLPAACPSSRPRGSRIDSART